MRNAAITFTMLLMSCGFAVNASKESTLLRQNLMEESDMESIKFPVLVTAKLVGESNVVYELDILEFQGSHNDVTLIVHDKQEARMILNHDGLDNIQVHEIKTNHFKQGPARSLQSSDRVPGFECYRNLNASYEFMMQMQQVYPNLVQVIDIGDSYLKMMNSASGYDIFVLKITNPNSTIVNNKAPFFAMFGLHAREMAPPELGMRFAETMLQGYGVNADITTLLDTTEVHLLLQANPDARYVAENQQELSRRKNMRPSPPGTDPPCSEGTFGVDLNRNFPFKWGAPYASGSNNSCSIVYRGEYPASEPEVQTIINYTSFIFPQEQRKDDPQGRDLDTPYPENTTTGVFVDVHAFGEVTFWPFGFEERMSGNHQAFKAASFKFEHFNGHELGGAGEDRYNYNASGTTKDWAYGAFGVMSFLFELGTTFYQNCTYFEENIVTGNLQALMYAARLARTPYRLALGPDIIEMELEPATLVRPALTLGGGLVPPAGTPTLLVVTVKASDDLLSSNRSATAQQNVASVKLYIDEHPDSENSQGIAMGGTLESTTATATLELHLVTDVYPRLNAPLTGRHIIHAQAEDDMGYKGPVSSIFLNVCEFNDAECLGE